jgi:pimeloyl-ACP methyl ester carboxylesterase
MNGPALLVLIHGALMDRLSMLALTPPLHGRQGVLCPDLAGHGRRRQQHRHLAALGPREMAEDLLEQLPLQALAAVVPLQLVGHSLGGLVALELQQLLHDGGGGAAALVLGDPPLCLSLDTPSQQAAAEGMVQDPVGQRLARDGFFSFAAGNAAAGADSPYLQR